MKLKSVSQKVYANFNNYLIPSIIKNMNLVVNLESRTQKKILWALFFIETRSKQILTVGELWFGSSSSTSRFQ